jgi:hypothetical protein
MRMTFPAAWKIKAPRLRTIAVWICEHTTMHAVTRPSFTSTDKVYRRVRYHIGKGRKGTKITVWSSPSECRQSALFSGDAAALLQHDSSETYRTNSEVVLWLEDYLAKHPKVLKGTSK